jgi:hypothetical protein
VAILGAVMTAAFAHSSRQSLAALNLNASIVHQLESNLAMLGSLDAPPGVDERTALAIRSSIAKAFVFGFGLVAVFCAVLAIASTVVAWRKIPTRRALRAQDFGGAQAAD